jgi:hypothetical protein
VQDGTTIGQLDQAAGDFLTIGSPTATAKYQPTGILFGATAVPAFSQTAPTSGAGANMTFTPQTAVTTGSNGSAVFAFSAPANGTVEGGLQVARSGTTIASLQALNGAATTGALYLGPGAASSTANNFTLYEQSNGAVTLGGNLASGSTFNISLNGGSNNVLGGVSYGGITVGNSVPGGIAIGNNELMIVNQTSTDTAAASGGIKMLATSGALQEVGTGGFVTTLAPAGTGTHSTQARQLGFQASMLTLAVGALATTIATVALATSATCATYNVTVIGRATTAFTGGAIGDTWAVTAQATFRNVGGTLTQVGATVALSTQTDTSMSSNALSFTTSGTNVLVQVTPPTGATGAADYTCQVTSVVN